MNGWNDGISSALAYIEEHLTEDLDINEIAGKAFVSSFYFQKIFNVLCGFTLGEYIRNRRLTLAAQELCTTDIKVIDAALKYGYDSPLWKKNSSRLWEFAENSIQKLRLSDC